LKVSKLLKTTLLITVLLLLVSGCTNESSNERVRLTAYATSEETSQANEAAKNAVDGDPATFWHIQWSEKVPQSITVKLSRLAKVNQVAYLPRQDGNSNGIITEYRLLYSTDGKDFIELVHGEWALNTDKKVVEFSPVEATQIRLEAIQGFGGWASAAEIEIGIVTEEN